MTSERFEQATVHLTQTAQEHAGQMIDRRDIGRGIIKISSHGPELSITHHTVVVSTRLSIGEHGIMLSHTFPSTPGEWTPSRKLGSDTDKHSRMLEFWADDIENGDVIGAVPSLEY